MHRSQAAATGVALVVACVAGACASHGSRADRRRGGEDLVVLLRDDTGTVGRAIVSNAGGTVDLDAEREGTRVAGERPPAEPKPMSESDVKALFGKALGALPAPPVRFTLNFKFQSDELTDESRALLPKILQVVSSRPEPDVIVVGHTDAMGTAPQNWELGMKRASSVRNLLIVAGMKPSLIQVTSLGERDLLVKTSDGIADPRNRRVDITVR
jgi:outer membrane protein OmpA-like peptidoglycan-associated protein